MLWFALLVLVPLSLFSAARRGVPIGGIRILFFAAVVGAALGLAGSGALAWFVDYPFDRWLLFSLIPVVTALVFHGGAVLGVHLWLRHRVRVRIRSPRSGQRLLREDRDVAFSSDADLAHALDVLEESLHVKYIPNRLVDTDRAWAYEAWAEVLQDDAPPSTYLMVPANARLRVRGAGPGNMRQIEPKNSDAVVVIVPGHLADKGATAIAAADHGFCAEVLERLRNVAG